MAARRGDPTVAIAGTGADAVLHGLAAMAAQAEVTLVASDDRPAALELAEQLGARACAYEDLPGSADLVVVATVPRLRARVGLEALESGARALIERPIASSVAEADALASTSRGRLHYAEHLVHSPVVATALEQVRDLEGVEHLLVRTTRPLAGPSGELTTLSTLATSALAVLLLSTTSRPRAVRVDGGSSGDGWAHVVEVTFDSGLVGTIEAAATSAGAEWSLEAACPSGVVRAELVPTPTVERDGERLSLPRPPQDLCGDPPTSTRLWELGYVTQIQSSLSGRGTLPASLGVAVLALLAALEESCALGRQVTVSASP